MSHQLMSHQLSTASVTFNLELKPKCWLSSDRSLQIMLLLVTLGLVVIDLELKQNPSRSCAHDRVINIDI